MSHRNCSECMHRELPSTAEPCRTCFDVLAGAGRPGWRPNVGNFEQANIFGGMDTEASLKHAAEIQEIRHRQQETKGGAADTSDLPAFQGGEQPNLFNFTE